MPNSNDGTKSRFYAYVLTYYKNNPYTMLDKFSSLISSVAEEVSIDWEETRRNVSLDGSKVSGRGVVGLTKNDIGRCWVIGFENSHSWEIEDEKYTIKYPSIRFQNFRKHFPEPVLFDGYKALMDEYERYKIGDRVKRVKTNPQKKNEYLARVNQLKMEEKQAQADAIEKDHKWLRYMDACSEACPYFSSKGVPELYQWSQMYVGSTTKGPHIGRFTAITLLQLDTGEFRGIQRIYSESNKKVFRKGLNPSSSCFVVPTRLPVNGETIYILEAPADAGMAYKLTGFFSVAAMYADNIPLIAEMIRKLCPDSPIIFIADNDQYGGANKGVETCENALRVTEGEAYMLIPQFGESEKKKQYKDVTDFSLAYGENKTKEFLLSYTS